MHVAARAAPAFEQEPDARFGFVDLLRFLVELLGKQRDRLDHVLTAIENEKKLSRTNEVDQLHACIFRFECKSQGCRDSRLNMARIGEAFQVNKVDFAAKLFGSGAANSAGNDRLANAARSKQCYEPLVSKLVANLADHRFAPNYHKRSRREPALLSGPVVPALRTACHRYHGADERLSPSLNICDVSFAKLTAPTLLAYPAHLQSNPPFLNDYVRPDVIDELLLRDELTWALGKINQDVESPPAKGQHHTLAPQQPFANRKFERAELQLSISSRVRHGFKAQHENSRTFARCDSLGCVPGFSDSLS